jgi:hypothetical protein
MEASQYILIDGVVGSWNCSHRYMFTPCVTFSLGMWCWLGGVYVVYGDNEKLPFCCWVQVTRARMNVNIYLCEQFQDPITPSINIYYWLRNNLNTCKKLTIKDRSKQQLIADLVECMWYMVTMRSFHFVVGSKLQEQEWMLWSRTSFILGTELLSTFWLWLVVII